MNKVEKQVIKEICINLVLIFVLVWIVIWCISCTPANVTRPWQTVAKEPCETTKVWTNWYAAEVGTTCMINGKDTVVATNHTDIAIIGAVVAGVGGIIAAAIGLI